ncbi:MAG: hypothetical protein ACO3MF_03245 [Acholeplasmataceae bacterium]
MIKKQTRVGEVSFITLENEYLKVELASYGASLFHLYVKTPIGLKEVSVQPNDIDEFLTSDYYYGKTVGRTAGRIFGPTYDIDDVTYFLNEEVLLHSGEGGFSFKHFDILEFHQEKVIFQAVSYEDEGPYDGVLTLQASYELKGNTLIMGHRAQTTMPTLCNITNHVYLNLDQQKTIRNQNITIDSDTYLHIDDQNKVMYVSDVSNSPFDFRQSTPFAGHLDNMMDTSFKGFDHTFLLNENKKLIVSSDTIKMTLETSYPAVVLYTHNKVSPHELIHEKINDNRHIAFTVECQFEPGGVQVEGLNAAILRPGETYEHFIALEFES